MSEKGIDANIQLPELGAVRQTCGDLEGAGLRVGLVVSRFNTELTHALATSAVSALRACGVADADLQVLWVPGAFEIPAVIEQLAQTGRFDALIALGVVVQGETRHAEMIDQQVARGLMDTAKAHGLPVIHEVVGAYSIEQAEARCLGGEGSRGWYAGLAAVETVRSCTKWGEVQV